MKQRSFSLKKIFFVELFAPFCHSFSTLKLTNWLNNSSKKDEGKISRLVIFRRHQFSFCNVGIFVLVILFFVCASGYRFLPDILVYIQNRRFVFLFELFTFALFCIIINLQHPILPFFIFLKHFFSFIWSSFASNGNTMTKEGQISMLGKSISENYNQKERNENWWKQ